MSTVSGPESKLDTPVQFLKGVGPRLAESLKKLGIETVRDALYYLPRRYEDRRNLPPIGKIRPGEFVTIRGRVAGIDSRAIGRGRVLIKVAVSDGTGTVTLTFFNQPWTLKKFQGYAGEVVAFGQVKESGWAYEISSPEYELVDAEDSGDAFARIMPVYALTDGVFQSTVRRATASAVERYIDAVDETLPEWLRKKYKLQPLRWSIRQIHGPDDDASRAAARRRLVFDEFFSFQVTLESRRRATHSEAGIAFPLASIGTEPSAMASNTLYADPAASGLTLREQAKRLAPFELTGAQNRVLEEIWADMARPYPMNRLLQGDVGSGKTIVAACAALAAIRCGYQVALMAPTEILAEQHYLRLRSIFEPVGIEVALLVGKQTKSQKRAVAAKAKHAHAALVVGTHALIQESVEFDRLGLVLIDEQHRFGVMQRVALRQKGVNPDVLVMTATPIPRTLAMTLYGDLDVSIIDELPPGRKDVKTHWRPLESRDKVYQQARELVEQGRQVYIVCPMVADSEKILAQAATDLHYRLSETVYADLRVGLLHGQMKAKEKESVMERFRAQELDILVATTVIEVGVDVPNASVMIIEDANRFGLAQLHQLRGRVGRGEFQSYCILLADARNEDAQARMEALVATNDGFKIAEEDLRLRGAGEMLGAKQSGNLEFDIADLVQDGQLLEVARQAAQDLLDLDADLTKPEHRAILDMTTRRQAPTAQILVS